MCPLPLADGDHAEVGRKHEADTHRVLILVRQRLFGEALRHSLIKAGQHMTVDVATSGSEALSAIGQARPDVVVVGARVVVVPSGSGLVTTISRIGRPEDASRES